jgi:hypothetical protein
VNTVPRTVPPAGRRDPVNDLYDRGCDLVEAAAALRRRAEDPRAAPATAAVLGCIEAALQDLADASEALGRVSSAAIDGDSDEDGGARARARLEGRRERLLRGAANLEVALHDAAAAAAAARSLAGRALRRAIR